MAAPAASLQFTYSFRDARGYIARMKVIIGDATNSAVVVDANTLVGHLRAASNAFAEINTDTFKPLTYGTAATFENVEDKAVLTFRSTDTGRLSRFSLPAPKSAVFLADQMTVDTSNALISAVINDFTTFVYANDQATAPLAFVGGLRTRRRNQRKINIFTLNPAGTGPAE